MTDTNRTIQDVIDTLERRARNAQRKYRTLHYWNSESDAQWARKTAFREAIALLKDIPS